MHISTPTQMKMPPLVPIKNYEISFTVFSNYGDTDTLRITEIDFFTKNRNVMKVSNVQFERYVDFKNVESLTNNVAFEEDQETQESPKF